MCAGQEVDEQALVRLYRELVPARVSMADFDRAVALRGRLVALAQLVAVRPLVAADYPRALFFDDNPKRVAWELERIRPVVPAEWVGLPGFSRVPRALVRAA